MRHPDKGSSIGIGRNVVEEISVAEAPTVSDAFRMDLVDGDRDFSNFLDAEQAPDDGKSITPIVRQVVAITILFGDLQGSRTPHEISPTPLEGYTQLFDISMNLARQELTSRGDVVL